LVNLKKDEVMQTTATTTRRQLCSLYISHVFPVHASGDTGCFICFFLALFFAAATSKVVMIVVSVACTASTLSALRYSKREISTPASTQ